MTAAAIAGMTEKEWAGQVADLCRMLGWRRYHTYRSERSAPGFPDETLVRDRIVFLELKTEKGKLGDAQKDWLSALLDAGAEAYVARPSDLDDLAKILACRGNPFHSGAVRYAAERLLARTRPEVPVPAD